MAALSSLLEEQDKKEAWKSYTAQVLAGIAGAIGIEVKPYNDFMHPEYLDTRSGKEIIEDLILKMEGGNK